MKIGINQPYLFPYIGYFQLINAVDKFIILDDVNFMKKGWISRNRILVNNKVLMFSLPLVDSSQNKLIKDCYICDGDKWKKKFLKTIMMSYKKAPYFNHVYPILDKIISYSENNLSQYNYYSLRLLCDYLGIMTEIIKRPYNFYNNEHLKAQEKLIYICKQENSSNYLNGIGGKNLYDKNEFEREGIVLNFLKTNEITYNQFSNEFVPLLSIIDVIMFNSPETINDILNQYELI